MAPSYKQEMPPTGGYDPITWERIPAKQLLRGYTIFGLVGAGFLVGCYFYKKACKRLKIVEVETNDSRIALEPIFFAERDRLYLKQIRKNRDEETELMKNVPGWETGTYYGEPIYKTVPKEQWVDPLITEYYAHTSKRTFDKRQYLGLTQ